MSAHDKRNSGKSGFATRAIHHGYNPQSHNGALNPPVYMSSTFAFETAEQGGRFFAGDEQGFIYSRIANPTLDLLEKRLSHRVTSSLLIVRCMAAPLPFSVMVWKSSASNIPMLI